MKDYKMYISKINTERKLKTEKAAAPKPEPKPQHTSKGVAVRIDRKTVVFLKPGTNIAEFKKTYENRPRM